MRAERSAGFRVCQSGESIDESGRGRRAGGAPIGEAGRVTEGRAQDAPRAAPSPRFVNGRVKLAGSLGGGLGESEEMPGACAALGIAADPALIRICGIDAASAPGAGWGREAPLRDRRGEPAWASNGTVTDAGAMQVLAGGLVGVDGTLVVIGAFGAPSAGSLDLVMKRAAVKGRCSGTAADSEDTLAFSRLTKVASMDEVYPLEEAQAADDRMMGGKARFPVVLKMPAEQRRPPATAPRRRRRGRRCAAGRTASPPAGTAASRRAPRRG